MTLEETDKFLSEVYKKQLDDSDEDIIKILESLNGKSSTLDIIDKILKSRTYIKDPSEAPEGANVKRGSKGGLYYDGNGKNEESINEKPQVSNLKTTSIIQNGKTFKTGIPVEFEYIRNTQKSPKHPNPERFGQNLEPSGRYVNFKEIDFIPEGWESGKIQFNNPIVLEWGTTSNESHGWKSRLSQQFDGKTGKKLTIAIKNAGYDGIVTTTEDHTSEIVDLTK